MCFLKHSISAWGKSKSPWHRPCLDLEGVIYLETSHWGRKEKTFWTSGYNELLSCTKFFEMGSYFGAGFREETQFFLKYFYRKLSTIASLACALGEPFKKTQHHALKMRSGELEMPIKARFMHCITGRMFHSWGSASTQPKESQNNLEGSAAVKCNYWAPSLSVLLRERDKELFLKITNLVRCHSHSQSIFIY